MAAKYAFNWVFGDSFDQTIVWKPGGVIKDITGYTVDMKIRDAATNETLLHLSLSNGISIPLPLTGAIVIAATPTIMKNGSLVNKDVVHNYDLQIRSSDGSDLRTLLRGAVVVEKEYTDVD